VECFRANYYIQHQINTERRAELQQHTSLSLLLHLTYQHSLPLSALVKQTISEEKWLTKIIASLAG
jgi:hypothetical protein